MRIKNKITAGLVLALLLLLTGYVASLKLENAQLEKQLIERPVTDTVFVPKPYEVLKIKTKYVEVPKLVKAYAADSALRDTAEKRDIITGIRLNPRLIKIDRINPQGIVFSNSYDLPAIRSLTIDGTGNLQVKKKRKAGLKILGTAAAIGAGFIIHNQIKNNQFNKHGNN